MNITIPKSIFSAIRRWTKQVPWEFYVIMLAVEISLLTIVTAYFYDIIVVYGDAESHLNIAKRVVTSLTPGLAQLGGIWLPLPHILMLPFIWFDPLWYTGIAGSIVSGCAYVVSAIFIFKYTRMLTKDGFVSFIAFAVFASNPNILYVQSTPMTEMVLICFFILSSYFFTKFILNRTDYRSLLLAAVFGFCATISRYDGWFLVLAEAGIIILLYFPWTKKTFAEMEGKLILFTTLAFIGIALWMFWDFLILGDPLYFTNSEFSAKSQQSAWLAKGELPAYKNLTVAFWYYFLTAMSNTGILPYFVSIAGALMYLREKISFHRLFIVGLFLVPFIFNVVTMVMGQSVIFIPSFTPSSFEWTLFNVRYGVMMMPFVALFFAYAFLRSRAVLRIGLLLLLFFQFVLYAVGFSPIITMQDGIEGLSNQKQDFAVIWMRENYDGGYVLLDDYARSISITRSRIPMQNIIYLGNKPYWELALERPQNYAEWIIMQVDDIVWKTILDDDTKRANLYQYYEKVYTSPNILIFKRMPQYRTDFQP